MPAFVRNFSPSWTDYFATQTHLLTTDVADDGTFTIAYPAGTSQQTFIDGLAGAGHYLIINGNDRWNAADPGFSLTFGASNITVTNLTGGTWSANSTFVFYIQRRNPDDAVLLSFPITLAQITGAGDVVTNIKPGIKGVIEEVWFVVTSAVTTAAKAATLNLEIGTTNVTGGTVALTSANCTPLGAVIKNAASPSANNVLAEDSQLSIEAASVTAFAEGAGVLWVRVRKS